MKQRIIFAGALSAFTVGTFILSTSPVLPELRHALSIPSDALGLPGGVYAVTLGITAALGSIIQLKVRRPVIMRVGMVAHFLGLVLVATSHRFTTLLVGYTCAGLGAGLFLPASISLITEQTSDTDRASTLSKVNIGWALCTLVGVPAAGWLATILSWRSSYLGLALLWPLSAALFGPALSLRRQTKVVDRHAARLPRWIYYVIASTFMLFFSFYGTYEYLGSAVRAAQEASSSVAGAFVLAYGVGFLTGTFCGPVIDRIGAWTISSIALAAMIVFFSSLPYMVGYGLVLPAFLFLWGICQNLAFTSIVTILSTIGTLQRAQALSLYQAALSFGASVGTAAMGWLYSAAGFNFVGFACTAVVGLSLLVLVRARRLAAS